MNFGHDPEPFGKWWPDTVMLLNKAVHRGGNSWGEVIAGLRDGTAQLWLATDPEPVAAMVTTGDDDTLEVWLAGGAVVPRCVGFLQIVERIAASGGATKGRITGRKGWARVLKSSGWRVSGEDLVKDLGNG